MNLYDKISKSKKQLTVAIDFDGFLVEDKWPEIGEAIWGNLIYAQGLQYAGHKLILWTCRCGDLLEEAIDFCEGLGLQFDAVNENLPETIEKYGSESRKISADFYLDDRAFNDFYTEVKK